MIKEFFEVLVDPINAFTKLKERTLEDTLASYLKLALLSGLAAALTSILITFIRAWYWATFKGVPVDFFRLANYYMQVGIGTFFFYIFAATVIFTIISLIVNAFVKHIKYVEIVKIMCYAFSPVILFGWVQRTVGLVLLIWTLVLLISGIKVASLTKPRKTSRVS